MSSVLMVVRDVCLAVGVNPLTSLFASSVQPRTQAEMLSLANEMAQRIAYDVREWTQLKTTGTFYGNGVIDRFSMPENYKRMLLTSQIYPNWAPYQPLKFIADWDEWLARRMTGGTSSWGEWTLQGNDMLFYPVIPAGNWVNFAYLNKLCIDNGSGGGDIFQNDADEFKLSHRLLKLGMIWQWKCNKGSPYAEDLGTYSDALVMEAGSDKPAPIIIDRQPINMPPVSFSWTPPP